MSNSLNNLSEPSLAFILRKPLFFLRLSGMVNWASISPNTVILSHLCEMPSFIHLVYFFPAHSRNCAAILLLRSIILLEGICLLFQQLCSATSRLNSNFTHDVLSSSLIWNKFTLFLCSHSTLYLYIRVRWDCF